MEIILGVAVLAFLTFVVIGRLTGRVTVQCCCTLNAGDPTLDLRISPLPPSECTDSGRTASDSAR